MKKLKKIIATSLAACYLVGAVPPQISNQNVKAANDNDFISAVLGHALVYTFERHPKVAIGTNIAFSPLLIYKFLKWAGKEFNRDIMSPIYSKFINMVSYGRKRIDSDPVKFHSNATEYLKQYIFGQSCAIDKVVSILAGYIDLWNQGSSNNKSDIGACCMVLIGPPGTGKTFTAQLISQYIFGTSMEKWQFITSSAIPDSHGTSDTRPTNIYFNSFGQNTTPNGGNLYAQPSPADLLFNTRSTLFRQLRNNRHVVVFIDEIDKIHKKDPNDTILERLRDAKDTGLLRFYEKPNEYVDLNVQGTVFILSSNELPECWGHPQKYLKPAQKAARTYEEHDQSLVTRFDVVEYDDFHADSYSFVLKKLVPALEKDFLKNYHLKINFSNDFFDQIGQSAETKNKGIRGLNDYLVLLRGCIIKYCAQNDISKNNDKTISLNIDYTITDDSFIITD